MAVAVEITADANAFGMIAAKTGMNSVVPFKLVNEPRGRQRLWAEPAAQIKKSCHNAQNHNSNARQSRQRAASAQGRWLFFRGRGRITRQLFAPMPCWSTYSWSPIHFQTIDNVHPRPIDMQYSPCVPRSAACNLPQENLSFHAVLHFDSRRISTTARGGPASDNHSFG